VEQQLLEGIEFHERRYRRASKYLAYFQAYSNTYGNFEKIIPLYEEALRVPGVAGLIVGTRPDCIDEEKLDYFRRISKEFYVSIEYGIESCYDKTLQRINRGHTFNDSVKALELTDNYGLNAGAHMIFGLPGESRDEMLREASILSELPIKTIKFHQLQILKNTQMVLEFRDHPDDFVRFSLQDYIHFITEFIEKLNPGFIIERFAGEVPPKNLSAAGWGEIRYDQVLNRIEKHLESVNSWQGKYFKKVENF
jgi:radical SAM protein (TIGR01212 family)